MIFLRDFAEDRHRTVDDRPYGGGEGMLLKPDVMHRGWKSMQKAKTLYLSPQGTVLDQKKAWELSREPALNLICGHYEGVDQRFIEECVDEEISIGDYVLTGGELPAMVLMDTVVRLLPGVLGNPDSALKDSFQGGRLKYPQYTRPPEFLGKQVPEVLMSGNHPAIEKWRNDKSLESTLQKRPDLR